MNFHSIFVHFPIALLVIYSFFEMVNFKSLIRQQHWFYIKATLLIVGVISAFPTLSTGELLEDLPQYDHQLLELHSGFASASTNFFAVIAVIYILAMIYRNRQVDRVREGLELIPQGIREFVNKIISLANWLIRNRFFFIIPLIGIALLTITGGLGGVLSAGVGVDPIADFIYHLFF